MVRHATNAIEMQPDKLERGEAVLPPEVKRALTAAVAQELHKIHGGNAVLDWLEAEILVDGVLTRGGVERG